MKDNEMPDYWVQGETKPKRAESGGRGVVVYSYENGWKLKVTGDNPTTRNHNPANLWFGHGSDALKKAKAVGALYVDRDGFAVFPDWLTGLRAADSVWENMRRGNKTIDAAVDQFLSGDDPEKIEKRKKDLVDRAHGYRDKYGRPVDRNTHLSDLTEEQFAALRYYNNIQLEGWLGNVDKAKIEWISPSQGTHPSGGTRQPPSPTPQTPAGRTSPPASPTQPHSSLEAPQSPVHAASFVTDTPGGVELPEPWNKLLAYDPTQGFPLPPADPLAHHEGERFSSPFPSPMQNTIISRLEDILRPNLLTSPPQSGFFSSGTGNPSQTIARPSGPPKTIPRAPVARAAQPPFYSAKDQLDFLGRVYRVAKPISEATGLSLPFILAHAAYEVDFGKNIEGNNLFNLKADKGWEGPTHARGNETYRSYPSYEASMEDYLAHLQGNPRYAEMFEPDTRGNLGMLADAIDHAGYSEDPLYTFRILKAAQAPVMKRAVWQYRHWPPGESGGTD